MLDTDSILEIRAAVPAVRDMHESDLQDLSSNLLNSDRGKLLMKGENTKVKIIIALAVEPGITSAITVAFPLRALIAKEVSEADVVSTVAFLESIGSDRAIDLALAITFLFPHILPRPVLPRCHQPPPTEQDCIVLPLEQFLYAAISYDRANCVSALLQVHSASAFCSRIPIYRIAARLGATQCMAVILSEFPISQQLRQNEIDRALIDAASHGNIDCLDQLMRAGANPEAYGDDAVRCAILNGHFKLVEVLGVRIPDITSRLDKVIFVNACKHGNIDVVNTYAVGGADLMAFEGLGLKFAIDAGHTRVVQRIINDPSFDRARFNAAWWKSALSDAVSACHIETVRLIYMSGVSGLSFRDMLSLSAVLGSVSVATMIMELSPQRPSSSNIISGRVFPMWRGRAENLSDFQYCFLLACSFGNARMADIMRSAMLNAVPGGNNGNQRDELSQKIQYQGLVEACRRGCLNVVAFLLERGVQASGENGNEEPLRAAIDNKHERVAEVLIAHGSDTAKLQCVRTYGRFQPAVDLATGLANAFSSANTDATNEVNA